MSTDRQDWALGIGGGSGIGAALVARYRARETTTVVWDRDGERDCVKASVLDGSQSFNRLRIRAVDYDDHLDIG